MWQGDWIFNVCGMESYMTLEQLEPKEVFHYFKEICKWVKKDCRVKNCFVRGYLDLLIGTLAMLFMIS